MRGALISGLLALGLQASGAAATSFIGTGSPSSEVSLGGGIEITFNDAEKGDFGSLPLYGALFVGKPKFTISDEKIGQFNTDGTYYLSNSGMPSVRQFRFELPDDAQAFGFNFGGSETNWVLRSYDELNQFIEQLVIEPQMAAVNGAFFGLVADIDVRYVTLTALQLPSADVVYIDNFTYQGIVTEPSPIPLQGSWGFLGLGVLALAASSLRRARRK